MEDEIITRKLNFEHESGNAHYLKPGTVLEKRYQIDAIVGSGGMGAVYRARDLRFSAERPVAVKEIITQMKDEAVRQNLLIMLKREANLLATLNHASIPKIHDFFTIGNRSYLVMEFVPGKNLETLLEESEDPLPVNQIVSWAIELCDVLHYLHNHEPEPVVFRDMKPANVMITPHNHVVLVDFGIAKKFEAGQKGTMIGTEGYSPPEQYRGEASPKVDIYALGATMHHLLTDIDPRDEPPFTFDERPIRQLNPDVPLALENIVVSALQYDVNDRPKDAATMKEALINLARSSSALYSNQVTTSIHQDYEIKPIWRFECEDEIRGTPLYHQNRIYIGAYDHNLYALSAKTGEFIWKYAADAGVVSKPATFQDAVYVGSEDHRVHAVSTKTGRVLWTYYTEGPVRSSPVIRDQHVFIGSDDGFLHIINGTTGRRAFKIEGGSAIRTTPLITNERIYFGTEGGDLICTDFHGNIQWQTNARAAITSSPRAAENVICFGSVDGKVYALDPNNGWSLWEFRMESGTVSTPWIEDQRVYIGSADGNIYCINLQSSKKIWQFETENQIASSPRIRGDSLYCGGIDGSLYCLDAEKGHLQWKYTTAAPITGSPIIHDDIVYIGSLDNHLYALPA